MNSPIELPTTRQSRYFHQNVDIHDPNWIPVLNKTTPTPAPVPRSQTSTPFLENAQQFPSRGSSRAPTPKDNVSTHDRGNTRTNQPLELEARPLGVTTPRSQFMLFPKTSSTPDLRSTKQRQDARTSDSSEENNTSVGGRSTPGTASIMEEQVYTLPPSQVIKDDRSTLPSLSHRASTLSSRRTGVPTSKYNRKPTMDAPPPPALLSKSNSVSQQDTPRSLSDAHPLLPDTPRTIPISPPTRAHTISSQMRPPGVISPLDPLPMTVSGSNLTASPISERLPPLPTKDDYRAAIPTSPQEMEAPPLLPPPPPPIPEMPAAPVQRPDLYHRKSTASVRKARALHSHPSTPSLKDGVPPTFPSPLLGTPGARNSGSDSRRSTLYDMEPPTAAPQEPLPDLPPQVAKKPVSRDLPLRRQSRSNMSTTSLPKSLHSQTRSQHKELASFMTSKSTVVFRRFDDIHVKLLLSIQDEISQLERDLGELEAQREEEDPSADVERQRLKVRIMGELRKLLAEYDHLFSNWSSMQSAAADHDTRQQVEGWLASDIGGSESAREDLLWIKNCEDLSSLQIGEKSSQTQRDRQQLGKLQQQEEMLSQLAKMAETVEKKKQKKKRPSSRRGKASTDTNEVADDYGDEKFVSQQNDRKASSSFSSGGFAALFTSCTGKRK